jgi:hypothetical protein
MVDVGMNSQIIPDPVTVYAVSSSLVAAAEQCHEPAWPLTVQWDMLRLRIHCMDRSTDLHLDLLTV